MGDAEFASDDKEYETKPASHYCNGPLNVQTCAGDAVSGKAFDKSHTYIIALDVGTTTIRAHVYDETTAIRGTGSCKIHILYPQPGWVEVDENELWQQVQDVITAAISDAQITAKDIKCMGITVQRNTFITWDKETHKPFHRFIMWQDLRAADYVKSWNDSIILKVVLRLKWLIDNNDQLRRRIEERQVMFGCLDTWLLWKLTGHRVFATDYSNASSTMLFDPYQMEWSSIVCNTIGIPMHIFPPLMDTSGVFGECIPELFGGPIPITAMVADQQGAMYGQCCFNVGDVKCTMGTGTFIDCNTGQKPHASVAGLYPLVGWKIKDEIVYIAEGYAADTGNCLEWAKTLSLFDDVTETEAMARSVSSCNGIYFVPAFSGLQMPVNDDSAACLLIGLTLESTKQHIVRAMLESLAFRFALLYQTVLKETTTPLSTTIKCDGGVCNNSFLMQMIADLTNRSLDRPKHVDMTSLGAAFLAGLAVGVWKDKSELVSLRKTEQVFSSSLEQSKVAKLTYNEWLRAVDRSTNWHNSSV